MKRAYNMAKTCELADMVDQDGTEHVFGEQFGIKVRRLIAENADPDAQTLVFGSWHHTCLGSVNQI